MSSREAVRRLAAGGLPRALGRRFRNGGASCLLLLIFTTMVIALTWIFNAPPRAAVGPAHFRGLFDPSMNPEVKFWARDMRDAPPQVSIPTYWRRPTNLSKELEWNLRFTYLMEEKGQPYVGYPQWMSKFEVGSQRWLNAFAVFPGAVKEDENGIPRMHGVLGVRDDGVALWQTKKRPPPAHKTEGGVEAALKNGGFYLALSNALPLDRKTIDSRDPVCLDQIYDYAKLGDASIVITFYNEPLSTLLRTVHSVLNYTPPPLIREIILVDDHSNLTENLPGSDLYTHLAYLPKTKLIRLGERRGLVHARLTGARLATGQVLVILDSHVEVNIGWLEPQLERIRQNPSSIVFPQILAINSETFDLDAHSGIGCKISFRWSMVEQSSLSSTFTSADAVPSPSMAGGLFAADRDYFWHLGGYDEGFSMWGAENVEMGFRTWLCGGRLECVPCAKTYHIYRKKGTGYESPHDSLLRNRLRAARVWTDEFYAVARLFITNKKEMAIGALDAMLELKKRLNCRPFKWFLDHVDPEHDIVSVDSIGRHGEIRSQKSGLRKMCLDTMSHTNVGEEYDVFPCHNEGGTQHWIYLKEKKLLIPVSNERFCAGTNGRFVKCRESKADAVSWEIQKASNGVRFRSGNKCLGIVRDKEVHKEIKACAANDSSQVWVFDKFKPMHIKPLSFSDEYLQKQALFAAFSDFNDSIL